MESEGVSVGGLVEVSAASAVPYGNIGIDLSGDELGKSTQTGHRLAVLESVDEVLCGIAADGLQVFDLPLIDQIPNHSIIQIKVAHDLASSNQLSNRVVSNLHMVLVGSQGNRAEKPVLSKRILEKLVRVFDSSKSGNARLEFSSQFWIV